MAQHSQEDTRHNDWIEISHFARTSLAEDNNSWDFPPAPSRGSYLEGVRSLLLPHDGFSWASKLLLVTHQSLLIMANYCQSLRKP